jgi:hypothetical protein
MCRGTQAAAGKSACTGCGGMAATIRQDLEFGSDVEQLDIRCVDRLSPTGNALDGHT